MNDITNKFIGLFKIIRPVNCAITFATITVAGVFCTPYSIEIPWLKIILASFAGAFTAAAANIVNDYYDLEIDLVNRPDRILPKGTLSPMEAMSYYFLITLSSFFIASFVNLYALVIVILTSAGMYYYSFKLKKVPIVGNLVVSFFAGLAFIFGGISAGNWEPGLIPAVFAFLVNLIRELIKDIEDIEGDKAAGVITFPQKNGIPATLRLISLVNFVLIIATTIPFIYQIFKIEYFVVVMSTVNVFLVYVMKNLYLSQDTKTLGKLSSVLKLAMVFGLIAIFLGK